MYKELTQKLNKDVKFNPPATLEEIEEVEKKLAIELPKGIKNLLLEFNGENDLIFSTQDIIETNLTQRQIPCYMSFDSLLFIAGNGFGDYFGYAISKEEIKSSIYKWDHEDDSRIWSAGGLKDLIEKYYTDQTP